MFCIVSIPSKKHIAKVSDDIIRHVSAMNPGKKTFGIHEVLSGTEYKSEVFTTTAYLSSDEKIKEYGKKILLSLLPTHLE